VICRERKEDEYRKAATSEWHAAWPREMQKAEASGVVKRIEAPIPSPCSAAFGHGIRCSLVKPCMHAPL